MITIIGRRLFIPDCDRVLGTTDEANTKIKIKLSDETVEKFFPEGITSSAVNVTLVMETEEGDAFPSIAFVWAKDGVHEGYVNLVDRNYTGLVKARALLTYRGNDSVTVSMQTEEDYFYVTDDIDVSDDVNAGGSEYTAWDKLLTDIKAETSKITSTEKSLEETVKTVSDYAISAEKSANNANTAYESALAIKGNFDVVLQLASDAKDDAIQAKDDAIQARDTANDYADEAMGHSASSQYYSEESKKYSESAEAFKNEAFNIASSVDLTKESVEKTRDEVETIAGGVTAKVTEAVSAKVDAVNAKSSAESAKAQTEEYIIMAKGYANEAKTAKDVAVSAKDSTLRVVGDIESAIDAIIELQESLLPKAELG